MFAEKDGCTCYDETVRKCPVHKLTPERVEKYLAEEQTAPAKPIEVWGISNLTVGKLKQQLEGLPDDMPVVYQRIEDKYFFANGWSVIVGLWEQRQPYLNENKEVIFDGLVITDYIGAWDCYPIDTHLDIKVFAINAHY